MGENNKDCICNWCDFMPRKQKIHWKKTSGGSKGHAVIRLRIKPVYNNIKQFSA